MLVYTAVRMVLDMSATRVYATASFDSCRESKGAQQAAMGEKEGNDVSFPSIQKLVVSEFMKHGSLS
jgi:hypothetical protein